MIKNKIYEWFYRPLWKQLIPQWLTLFLIFLFFVIFYWSKNSLIINELNQQRKNSRQHINTLKTQLIQNITKNKLNTLINQRKQQITDLLTSMQTTTHSFEQFKFPPPTSGEKLIYWQQQNQNNRVDYYFTILASYYQLIAFIENLGLTKNTSTTTYSSAKNNTQKNNLHCEFILSSMTKSLI
uniref:Uncharacterized protein n=1 Tax=Arsenophonus endosymbiont of Trialeurodes vaporariorum TaxID=235567 RepID=A0A3B0M0T0_9GAMM